MTSELSFNYDRNTVPVYCAWCKDRLMSYAGYKILMSEDDALDYDWACPTCTEKIRFGAL